MTRIAWRPILLYGALLVRLARTRFTGRQAVAQQATQTVKTHVARIFNGLSGAAHGNLPRRRARLDCFLGFVAESALSPAQR